MVWKLLSKLFTFSRTVRQLLRKILSPASVHSTHLTSPLSKHIGQTAVQRTHQFDTDEGPLQSKRPTKNVAETMLQLLQTSNSATFHACFQEKKHRQSASTIHYSHNYFTIYSRLIFLQHCVCPQTICSSIYANFNYSQFKVLLMLYIYYFSLSDLAPLHYFIHTDVERTKRSEGSSLVLN